MEGHNDGYELAEERTNELEREQIRYASQTTEKKDKLRTNGGYDSLKKNQIPRCKLNKGCE
jgi:hypothetical protein